MLERRVGLAILIGAIAVGTSLRLWLALTEDGMYWPDEIFNSLEPAHQLAFGYALLPWEYIQGGRSWLLPALIAGVLKVSAAVGLGEPAGYLAVVRILLCGLAVATIAATYRLARNLGAGVLAASAGAAAMSLMAPMIYFAPRALTETVSTLPVVAGVALVFHPQPRRWQRLLGLSLLSVAVILRLNNLAFLVPLVALLALRWPRRQWLEGIGAVTAWGLAFGLSDLLTWGGWFHSAVRLIQYNLDNPDLYGTSPPVYYAQTLVTSGGVAAIAVGALAVIGGIRARVLGVVVLIYILAHTVVGHKELRFLVPAIPLACALAGVGLDTLRRSTPRWAYLGGVAGLVVFSMLSAALFHNLTFGDLGSNQDIAIRTQPKAQLSAYDDGGPIKRLLLDVRTRSDLCGLKVEAQRLGWAGGFIYLHRRVRLYSPTGPDRTSAFYNYVITTGDDATVADIVAVDHGYALARLPNAKCQPDPYYPADT